MTAAHWLTIQRICWDSDLGTGMSAVIETSDYPEKDLAEFYNKLYWNGRYKSEKDKFHSLLIKYDKPVKSLDDPIYPLDETE